MKKIKCLTFSVLFMVFAFVFSATAQTTTSTIEGIVTDVNGAVVAGATIKASGTTLAAERSVTSDKDGFYRIVALPAGAYIVTISQTGFANNANKIELTLNKVCRS